MANATDHLLAQKTAEKYYKFERLATHHASILEASDHTALIEAHAAYAAHCPVQEGFTPPSSEMDDYINLAERSAEMQCNSLLDHITVLNSAAFLMRLYSLQAIEKDLEIYYAAMRLRTEMERNNSLPRPPTPQHFVVHAPQHIVTPPSADVPPTLYHLAEAFTLDAVVNLPRMEVSTADIDKLQRNPDNLLGETFVYTDGDNESAFSVSTIMMVGKGLKKEKFFYVQYADEGDVSFPFKSDDFFELLAKSAQVIV